MGAELAMLEPAKRARRANELLACCLVASITPAPSQERHVLARIVFDGHHYPSPNGLSAHVDSLLSVLQQMSLVHSWRCLLGGAAVHVRDPWIHGWLCVLVSLVTKISVYGGLDNFGQFEMLHGMERAAKQIPGSRQTRQTLKLWCVCG